MKTKKLKCVVTGRVLFSTRDYYERKLKQHDGDEDQLKSKYICKEAKKLIQNGYTVDVIREMLNVKEDLPPVSDEIIEEIQKSDKSYLRNMTASTVPGLMSSVVPNTDPDVKKFIETITRR
jgi:hypothetical protein